MQEWQIQIKGITPIMWSRPKKELADELKKLKSNQMDEWELNNWHRKAEYDPKGNLIIPSTWQRGCLRDSCKMNRIVPHFARSKKETYTSYVESMFYQDAILSAMEKDLIPYVAFVNRGTKTQPRKVWTTRPMLESWEATLIIKDNFGRMQKEELKEIVDFAGMMIGMGDARKLNFGRFEVMSIKEINGR